MRKLTSLFIALLCYLCSFATPGIYIYDASATPGYSLDVSNRNSNDEVTVTFKLNRLNVTESTQQPGKELVIINGFGQTTLPGTPSLPITNIKLAIQQSEQTLVEIVDASYEEMNCILASAEAPKPAISSASEIDPIIAYTGYNITAPISYVNIQTYRGRHIHNLMVSPVSYNI